MSAESLAIVLNHSKATGTAKIVLIGIANHDGDGGAWPALATLARYANVDERNARRAIERLISLGELKRFEKAGGTSRTPDHIRPNLYHITLECPPYCDRSRQHRDTRRAARYVPRYLDLIPEEYQGAESPPPGATALTTPGESAPTQGAGAPPELNQELPKEDHAPTSPTPVHAREQQQTCNGGCGQPLARGQMQSNGSCMRCITEPGWHTERGVA